MDAQQLTNQHFNQQKQLHNTSQQAQVDALRELNASNYQRNLDHIFVSIPIFDGSKNETFLNTLKA